MENKIYNRSITAEKSMDFAVRIVNLCKFLKKRNEYVLSKQVLRSGTAIGALVREGQFAQSKKDFINKLSISIKESNETDYWLELLFKTEYIEEKQYLSLKKDCDELLKLLTSSINTAKKNLEKK